MNLQVSLLLLVESTLLFLYSVDATETEKAQSPATAVDEKKPSEEKRFGAIPFSGAFDKKSSAELSVDKRFGAIPMDPSEFLSAAKRFGSVPLTGMEKRFGSIPLFGDTMQDKRFDGFAGPFAAPQSSESSASAETSSEEGMEREREPELRFEGGHFVKRFGALPMQFNEDLMGAEGKRFGAVPANFGGVLFEQKRFGAIPMENHFMNKRSAAANRAARVKFSRQRMRL